jgi:DNA-binding transcriptional LysR family regulator
MATAVRLVAEHVALAIAPQLSINSNSSPGIMAVPIRKPSISRTLGLLFRRNVPLSKSAATMLAIVKERFQELKGEKEP